MKKWNFEKLFLLIIMTLFSTRSYFYILYQFKVQLRYTNWIF